MGYISRDQFVLLPLSLKDSVEDPIEYTGNHIGPANNRTQLNNEVQERYPIGVNIDNHPPNPIVEVYRRHMTDLGIVVARSVLEGFCEGKDHGVLVNGWHDVDVVVGHPAAVGLLRKRTDFGGPFQAAQFGLWVVPLDVVHRIGRPEVEVVDFVAGIQSGDHSVDYQPGIEILVSMARHVEIPRHLLNSKSANKPTSQFLLKGLFGQFVLPHLVGFVEDLKGSLFEEIPIFVESSFLD